ncbi:MAG: vitamin B12 dependent-methionine synthase activation domain-containing protein [Acidobacteriota bacterium]
MLTKRRIELVKSLGRGRITRRTVEILKNIPIRLDFNELAKRLRFKPGGSGSPNLEELVEIAQSLIEPRAVFQASFTGEKRKNTVTVDGVVFSSRVLRVNLEKAHKVFPYVLTVGKALEEKASSFHDLLRQYFLEEIANIALGKALQLLGEQIRKEHGLPQLSDMSPGSLEDWPITEQPKLFSLFGDTEKSVGVRLTESLLMIPRKSISGILFPTEETFLSCQLCPRHVCEGRRAPYDRVLRKKYLDESSNQA